MPAGLVAHTAPPPPHTHTHTTAPRPDHLAPQAAKDVAGGSLEAAATLISADRHAAKYRACGKPCIEGIAAYFKEDLESMKIELPAGPP